MRADAALAASIAAAVALAPAGTVARHHGPRAAAVAARPVTPDRGRADDQYRERGYGYGGTVFVPRAAGGGPALGGTCTELAGTPGCHRSGIYGNGFEYGFGSP